MLFSNRFAVLIVTIFFSLGVYAQVSFKAYLSMHELEENEMIVATFEIKGGEPENFKAPDFSNFTVVSGPSTMQSYSIVNGKASSFVKYTYNLLAHQPGNFVLEPAMVTIKGKEYTSNASKVLVKPSSFKPSKRGLNDEQEIQVKIEIPKDSIYIGEAAKLYIDLYSKVDIKTINYLKSLDIGNMKSAKMSNFSQAPREVKIGKDTYMARSIDGLLLFPDQEGITQVGPLAIQANVVAGKPVRGFFGYQTPTKPVQVVSSTKKLVVLPLPNPKPKDFCGAVGKWTFTTGYSDYTNFTLADALVLRVKIEGNGNLDYIKAPVLNLPDGWKTYPAKQYHSGYQNNGSSDLAAVVIYEYSVLPTKPGKSSIAPTFSFFDTESKTYQQVQSPPIQINVQNVGSIQQIVDNSVENVQNELKLLPVSKKESSQLWVKSLWYWLLLIGIPIGALLFVGGYVVIKKRTKAESIDRVDPLAEGRRRLQEARSNLNDPNKFYPAFRAALDGYAIERLNLLPSDQTESNMTQAFVGLGKTSQDAKQLSMQFIDARQMSDRGSYGGGISLPERQEAINTFETVLSI